VDAKFRRHQPDVAAARRPATSVVTSLYAVQRVYGVR